MQNTNADSVEAKSIPTKRRLKEKTKSTVTTFLFFKKPKFNCLFFPSLELKRKVCDESASAAAEAKKKKKEEQKSLTEFLYSNGEHCQVLFNQNGAWFSLP